PLLPERAGGRAALDGVRGRSSAALDPRGVGRPRGRSARPAGHVSLAALQTREGVYCMLALDHRAALVNAFRKAGVEDVSPERMLETKARIMSIVGENASGVLLDHAAVSSRPAGAGLLVPLEAQGHEPLAGARVNTLEHSASDAAALEWALLGGSEVDGETFADQLATACRAGAKGFIAGRAIWSGCLGLEPAEQERWLRDEACPLFDRLVSITLAERLQSATEGG